MRWTVAPHPGTPLEPHDLWSAWNADISVLIPLLLTIMIYAWGVRRIWQRAGPQRGITQRQILAFIGAMVAFMVALLSPLDALSGVLFSAHMTQHLILMMIAAPLLVLSNIQLAFLWLLPSGAAHRTGYSFNRSRLLPRLWNTLTQPVAAWLIFAISLWVWHIPTFYTAALNNETLHWLEHVLLLLSALLFWWALFKYTVQKHIQYGMAVLYLFTTLLQSGVLGALMTFTEQPWYSYYAALTPAWGFTPLQDQQLAGLIMWIPGGAIFTVLTIAYFSSWLRAMEERSLTRTRGST